MGSTKDFTEMFKSPKGGWTRESLAQMGVAWPPKKGWRSRLLQGLNPNQRPAPKKVKKPVWKKLRPNSNEELENLLKIERQMTAFWYQRMSGSVAWAPGEKERHMERMRIQAGEVYAEIFANLPEE